jgi:hypothetical protein
MSEPLSNIESPLFFSTLGNLTSAEALAELNRLKSQQVQVRSEINRVKNEKEMNGAKLIRCKSSLKNDCGELDYRLNQLVQDYYHLQSQDDGLTKEIARLGSMTGGGFQNAVGDNKYRNLVGDTPVTFDWISRETFSGTANPNKTGIHSVMAQNLVVGDYVTLVSSNARYNGDFQVSELGSATGQYSQYMFCIDVVPLAKEIASGTWQRVAAVPNCQDDQELIDNKCVPTLTPDQKTTLVELTQLRNQRLALLLQIDDALNKINIDREALASCRLTQNDCREYEYSLDQSTAEHGVLRNQQTILDNEITRVQLIYDNLISASYGGLKYDWIVLQTVDCISKTGIHTTLHHGLRVGDKVRVLETDGYWNHSGVYNVEEIKDVVNGNNAGSLIVINQITNTKVSSGFWKKAEADAPITPYDGTIANTCGKIAYDWITTQTLRGIPMTGIHSTVAHELFIGAKVRITQTTGNWSRDGVYSVQEVKSYINGNYNGYLIVINQRMEIGEVSAGFWKSIPTNTEETPYRCANGYNLDTTTSLCVLNDCPTGQEKIGGSCVPICKTNQTRINGVCTDNKKCNFLTKFENGACVPKTVSMMGYDMPIWALYVGGALVVGLIGFSIYKSVKNR